MNTYPNPQGLSSKTFSVPPIDGSLTVPEMWDYNMSHSPNHPLFLFDDVDGSLKTISWSQGNRAIHTAARLVQSKLHLSKTNPQNTPPVVIILALADAFSYFAMIAGIVRAGCIAFPVSTRNTDATVAHLIQKTGAKYVFISGDNAMKNLASGARKLVAADGAGDVELLSMPSFDEIFGSSIDGEGFVPLPPLTHPDKDAIAFILHSSGSTGFPKPIPFTHRFVLQMARAPYFGEVDLCGEVMGVHALPPFHVMAFATFFWSSSVGLSLSAFRPSVPPTVPTSGRTLEASVKTGSALVFVTPAYVEEWARDMEHVATLAKMKAVLYGGAPLQKEAGDLLVEHGVKPLVIYGSTECAALDTIILKDTPKDGWDYFKINRNINPAFIQQEEDNVFQLIVMESETNSPAIFNTEINGRKAYDTSDLLIRHPNDKSLWKIYGRKDDQITHSTGEKTNPVPLETTLTRDIRIENAIMFGRGRFHAGVLIKPADAYAFDPSDLEKLADFRNGIWESVEEANKLAPSYSRIFKEMVIVASLSKPFTYTGKGTPRRNAVLNAYEPEIEQAYAANRAAVETVISNPLGDDDDLFQNGCDSLQATWIRNTILHALRQSSTVDTRNVPQNFVYAHPTITRLGLYVGQIAMYGAASTKGSTGADAIAEMQRMVAKYSQNFPEHHRSSNGIAPKEEVVLLTGSTGGLGSYVLDCLIRDPSVSRIYALNRAESKGGKTSSDRQKAAFEEHGLDARQLIFRKVVFLEGDTVAGNLGLDKLAMDRVRKEVTAIIHNAWRVHFNVAISTMEPLIQGTRNLIDLALSSPHPTPPKFVFTSSIGVLTNWRGASAPESRLSDAAVAVASGYSESKWVAESILAEAAEKTALKPIVVRVGQLSGGINGCWTARDWLPAIVKSAETLGCLPRARGVVSWIPIHKAAAAIVGVRFSEKPFLHLAHPNPVAWDDIFRHFSTILGVPMVEYQEWLTKLEEIANDKQAFMNNPAVHLLHFFQSVNKPVASDDAESLGFPSLETSAAVQVAPSMRCPSLGKDDVEMWVTYWRKAGFLNGKAT